jgi:membrane fusion protein (multidrug efflux system)
MADQQPVPTKRRHGPLFWVIVLALGTISAFWLFHFFVRAYHYESTDNAYINAHVHQISPRVAGAVTEVLAEDNQTVKAGQALARIDPLEYEIALHKAQANLAQSKAQESQARAAVHQTKAQVAQMKAQVAQAEAEVSRAGAQLEIAGENLGRNTRLYSADTRAIAKADVDTTKSAFATNEAMVNAAKANLEGARTTITATEAQVEAAEAQLDAARAGVAANEAAVRDAERELSYATLTAPVDGRIGNKNVEVGNRAQVGQGLFALVQPDLWIVANFKETQLAYMHAGQRVEFTIDAIPGHEFTGKIDSIAPATGAQFALLPPDNATGNFTKVVQRVPVKIVPDRESIRGFEDRLRPGLSTVIDVRVR